MMDESFDPYWQWLGIPPDERPVDHYRLLGLAMFESNPQRIEAVADARMNLVRSYQSGPRVAHTQKLLNELSVARLCLINTQAKASYDAVLRGRQALNAVTARHAANPPYPVANPMAAPFATPVTAGPPYPSGAAPTASLVPFPSFTASPIPAAIPYPVAPLPPPPPPPLPSAPMPPPQAFPVAPPRASAATPVAGEGEAPLETPRSLWASPWFTLVVVLALVGGAVGTWFLTRPRAPSNETDIVRSGEPDGESESDVPSVPAAGGNAKSTRSTIDEPFGPVEIIQEGTGEMHFSAQTAERAGDGLVLELRGDDQVIAGWSSADQSLVWNFRVLRPDVFRVELTYAATDEARGGRLAFQVDDDETKSGAIATTGTLDRFRTDIFHVPVHRNGRHQLYFTVQGLSAPGSVVFQTLRFVPKGISDKKKS